MWKFILKQLFPGPKPLTPSAYKFTCGSCNKPTIQIQQPEIMRIFGAEEQPLCLKCLNMITTEGVMQT